MTLFYWYRNRYKLNELYQPEAVVLWFVVQALAILEWLVELLATQLATFKCISLARSMDKSIFHEYFRPFLDHGGISITSAITTPVILRITKCSVFSVSMHIIIMHVTFGSQNVFERSDTIYNIIAVLTEVCWTMRVQVVLVMPVHWHLVIITQMTMLWPMFPFGGSTISGRRKGAVMLWLFKHN